MQRSVDESLDSYPLLVVDTETTGLPKDKDARIVELGAVIIDRDGEELASWSSLVRPPRAALACDGADEAMAVHGIDLALLERAPEAHHVERCFLEWVALRGLYVGGITSWRWSFDGCMLARLGAGRIAELHTARCVHDAARAHFGKMGRRYGPTLEDVAQALGVPVPQGRHRALADARLAGQVAVALDRIAADSGIRSFFYEPPAHLAMGGAA